MIDDGFAYEIRIALNVPTVNPDRAEEIVAAIDDALTDVLKKHGAEVVESEVYTY
jgi:hypothetical protein